MSIKDTLNNVVSIFKKPKDLTAKEKELDFKARQQEANPFSTFKRHAEAEMSALFVNISLVDAEVTPCPPDNAMVNGYFDDDPRPVFVCCIGKPLALWMPIFVHEYGHFLQWKENAPVWKDGTDQEVEADCERRVMQLIDEHNLPMDKDEYAQQANAYIHFYTYIDLYDKWYIAGKEPYRLKEVWSQFPMEVDADFSVSWEYIDLYNKHCF